MFSYDAMWCMCVNLLTLKALNLDSYHKSSVLCRTALKTEMHFLALNMTICIVIINTKQTGVIKVPSTILVTNGPKMVLLSFPTKQRHCWNKVQDFKQHMNLFKSVYLQTAVFSLLSGAQQMSLAVIKKYANLYSIYNRKTIKQNYTLFFSVRFTIFSLCHPFCLLLNHKKR